MKASHNQQGLALLMLVFIIALALTGYALKLYNPATLKAEQAKRTSQTLNEAKQALIAWAVSNNLHPGQFPYPDRAGGGGYDGFSDCSPSGTAFNDPLSYRLLIGKLPIYGQTAPCVSPQTGLGINTQDGQGNNLWYAVSRNVVHQYEHLAANPLSNPIINPSINNSSTYDWLRVLDRNGNLISNRVAAVIIAPGNAIGAQNRVGAASADNFLETFGAFSNSDYDSENEDFFMVEGSSDINDKLVYITIDELMYALEKRVLEEVKDKLNKYYAAHSYYPYAAGLGATVNPNQSVQGNLRGLLPINPPNDYSCSCDGDSNVCACHFSAVASTIFIKIAGVFDADGSANSPTGACSVNLATANMCACNGAGACLSNAGIVEFSCDACGNCTATVPGENVFATTAVFKDPTGACTTPSTIEAKCDNNIAGISTFTVAVSTDIEVPVSPAADGLPGWFVDNEWQDYIYYAVSDDCTNGGACAGALAVGAELNVRAVLASPNVEIITAPFTISKGAVQQARPSCDIRDYLDATENTNIPLVNDSQDGVYEPTQIKGQSYNDQIVIVAP